MHLRRRHRLAGRRSYRNLCIGGEKILHNSGHGGNVVYVNGDPLLVSQSRELNAYDRIKLEKQRLCSFPCAVKSSNGSKNKNKLNEGRRFPARPPRFCALYTLSVTALALPPCSARRIRRADTGHRSPSDGVRGGSGEYSPGETTPEPLPPPPRPFPRSQRPSRRLYRRKLPLRTKAAARVGCLRRARSLRVCILAVPRRRAASPPHQSPQ